MNRIEKFMKKNYRIELSPDDEGGYVVSYPELPGCLSVGDTVEEAIKNGEDAKREWFIAMIEEDMVIPEPEKNNDYSGQFKLRLPKSLHRSLVQRAKKEGISMNQYCLYLLSKGDSSLETLNLVTEKLKKYDE